MHPMVIIGMICAVIGGFYGGFLIPLVYSVPAIVIVIIWLFSIHETVAFLLGFVYVPLFVGILAGNIYFYNTVYQPTEVATEVTTEVVKVVEVTESFSVLDWLNTPIKGK